MIVSNISVTLQPGTDRTLVATWSWSNAKLDTYKIRWWYATSDGIPLLATESSTVHPHSTYTAPQNAVRAWFHVLPVAKTYKPDGKTETPYFTAKWSTYTEKTVYYFKNNPPTVPPKPSVTVKDGVLTAELSGLDLENATHVKFQVMIEGSTSPYKTSGSIPIVQGRASYTCTVATGNKYVVQCKSIGASGESAWSGENGNWSDVQGTEPSAPSQITELRAESATSVYLAWSAVPSAEDYEIEYADNRSYFDESNATRTQPTTKTTYTLTGLESGKEYFFRVRAHNQVGYSGWSGIKSIVIGEPPSPPTTWSTTTTAIVGDPLTLYWMHNSKDGSKETLAEIKLTIDGNTVTYTKTPEVDDEERVGFWPVDTSGYPEGTVITWQVRTKGVLDKPSEWSTLRTINVYSRPRLQITVKDHQNELVETLKSFPIKVSCSTEPNTQIPTGYHLTIVASSAYETTDHIGNVKMVSKGEVVCSKHYDTSEQLSVELSANDVDLENNIEYMIECTVSMNSGLTASASAIFMVAWTDDEHMPNAEVGIDTDTYSAIIRPYCENEYGVLSDDVLLSVYRRDYDGGFTEIIRNIENERGSFVTDPHPALDFACYRIVATTKSTGAVSFYDMPGIPVGGKAVVIQWNDTWSGFRVNEDTNSVSETPWTGSMLKLPYNIDVSDNYSPDVELVEYIGRSNPVSYYGTQRGETATWSVVIDANDTETLYELRRLAKWMGNVYVREPSGSGYWAHITVSFSHKHRDVTIPVQLEIARVEGGV